MSAGQLLGLPLQEALRRLRGLGIEPEVTVSLAPRRSRGEGALRVVRVSVDGRRVTACAFRDAVQEAEA